MKSYAIVLAAAGLAQTATSLIESISMWGPLVLMSTFIALVTVWMIRAEGNETQTHVSFRKAA